MPAEEGGFDQLPSGAVMRSTGSYGREPVRVRGGHTVGRPLPTHHRRRSVGGVHRVIRHRVVARPCMERHDIDAELSMSGARELLDFGAGRMPRFLQELAAQNQMTAGDWAD